MPLAKESSHRHGTIRGLHHSSGGSRIVRWFHWLNGPWRDELPAPYPAILKRIDASLESNLVTLLIVALTLIALFMDDCRVWIAAPSQDHAFFIVAFSIFIFFSLELLLNSLVKPGYFLSFFFFLDLIAAFSLIPDIPWLWYPMIGLTIEDATSSPRDIERALRMSSSSQNLFRVVRFVRLIRLVRIAKLFELCQRKAELESKRRSLANSGFVTNNGGGGGEHDDHNNHTQQENDLTKPSQVGQHLSEQTTRKVVLLVLAMLFGIPLLQPNLEQHGEDYTVQEVNAMINSNISLGTYNGPIWTVPDDPSSGLTPAASQAINTTLTNEINWILNYYGGSCLYLHVEGLYGEYTHLDAELDTHRTTEVKGVRVDRSVGLFSIRGHERLQGEYAVITTSVVLALLTIGAILFNRNNHRMVIVPIERMMATIVALQANPLAKASLSTLENDRDHNNETGMLERTLEKLTGLLQVGFGEAGSRMIQKCMNLNAEGDLDPLVDGTKMLAIFGFCDIRRFTDATECLKEDVMMYVNEIAAIVHSNVSLCDGNPNKNIGDAFLLVWRLPGDYMDGDDLFYMNENQPNATRPPLGALRKRDAILADTTLSKEEHAKTRERDQREIYESMLDRAKKAGASCPPIKRDIHPNVRQQVSILADKAVVSFLRIIVEIAASEEVRRYANHPRIKASFCDFEVTLGFGLHCGWAIEGPIGSRYKIDASYLSPHVNLSETLQDATKIYGLPLLVSGEFYSLLSPYLKSYFRRLDVVRVNGREAPMNLYGFDVVASALESVIADKTPAGYDEEDEITVLEFRAKNIILDDEFGDHHHHTTSSNHLPAHQNPNQIYQHELFRNPYLNAHHTHFTEYEFTQFEREHIHASSPIATYHLVRNFRLAALQCGIHRQFNDTYARGLEEYLSGNWPAAQKTLKRASDFYPDDKATKVLLNVMREHQFVAPLEWTGCHEV